MEKTGLIAAEFTDKLRHLCRQTEEKCNHRFSVGYCRSRAAESGGKSSDAEWARSCGAEFTPLLQELFRNSDVIMAADPSPEELTLVLMSAKRSFVLFNKPADRTSLNGYYATAEKYGTAVAFGLLDESGLSDRIICFYSGESNA